MAQLILTDSAKRAVKRQLLTAYVVFNWFGDYIITHYVVSVNVIVLHLEIFSKCFEILLERSFCNDIS